MDKLSHKTKSQLYSIVRDDCIEYIKDHKLYGQDGVIANYSVFNRHWNDTMRHAYNLKENYIWLGEFERLCLLARDNNHYQEGFVEKLYHDVFGYDYGYAWERAPLCDRGCCCFIGPCTFYTI